MIVREPLYILGGQRESGAGRRGLVRPVKENIWEHVCPIFV